MSSLAEIQELESLLGSPLPSDYKDFLMSSEAERSKYNGLEYEMPNQKSPWIETVEEIQSAQVVLRNLKENPYFTEGKTAAFTSGMVPICEAGFSYTLLSVRSADFGAIYFYFTEPGSLNADECMFRLAASFSVWVSGLRGRPEGT